MQFDTPAGKFELVDEAAYAFGGDANTRRYPVEQHFSAAGATPVGLLLGGQPLAVFGGDYPGGGLFPNSLAWVNGRGYLAVGDHVVCFTVQPFALLWAKEMDAMTCFGVHYDAAHNALLSHGETEIARFDENGEVLWAISGPDIFTDLSLTPDHIEATDFEGGVYRLDYATGRERQ